MDHTWNTFGLVSQGNNQDTCYVGKLQNDVMKSYEDIVNKTRSSDIPFIEANDRDFVYQESRPLDYNQRCWRWAVCGRFLWIPGQHIPSGQVTPRTDERIKMSEDVHWEFLCDTSTVRL
nr:uncharacterized protein LOC111125515 isoform X2 [Crassostrea virginica]